MAWEARRLRKALLGTALPMAKGRALCSEEAALLAQAGERLREVEAHLGRLRGALAAFLPAALAREPDPVRLEEARAALLEVLGRER